MFARTHAACFPSFGSVPDCRCLPVATRRYSFLFSPLTPLPPRAPCLLTLRIAKTYEHLDCARVRLFSRWRERFSSPAVLCCAACEECSRWNNYFVMRFNITYPVPVAPTPHGSILLLLLMVKPVNETVPAGVQLRGCLEWNFIYVLYFPTSSHNVELWW